MSLDFPLDDFRPDLQQLFSCQILRNLLINERRCCNSVNNSSLQFSGHTFIYKQSVGDLTLAQFLTHGIIPQKRQVFHYKYSKTLHWRFQKKRNSSNTGTRARPDRVVRFILASFLTREADNPMTGCDFDWMVSNHAVWGWKAPVKASVSGVSLLRLSPFFAFIFPLSPQKRLILRLFQCWGSCFLHKQ